MPRKKTNLTMPVLALRGLMVFPHMVLHFDVGRPKSVAALQEAMMNDQKIFLVAQKDVDDPDPTPENLCTVGTIANIRQVMNLPGDSLRVLVEGETRGELTTVTQEDPFLLGRIHLPKVTAPADEMELAALVRTAKDYFDAYARASQRVSQETIASIRDVDDAEQIADLIAANILTKLEDRQQILEEFDIQRRLERLCTILSREIELTGVEKQVQERVKKQIDKNQKDYYLREHMKAIQTELGDTDATDVEELRERAKNTPLNDEARQRVDKELERLSRMTPGTPEVGMSRTYIEWILDLPWGRQTTDNLDLKRARKVLAQDHYGLEKVKERIVEYLAVLKLKQDMRGPILCFVGPPGVGKTSIVRAIAKAVGRQFVQVSLGGVRDEAEIRGHRRTYIGAIPGRIISGMKQAGTMNPVFLFDEIDKMSHDFRGDPASAMLFLWVLNPEYGLLNNFLSWFGIRGPSWLSDPKFTKISLMIMDVWRCGQNTVIFLSALKAVPKSFYEAAELDGAGPVKRFFKITLPYISPTIQFLVVMGLISSFQYFTQAYVFASVSQVGQSITGGPQNSLLFYSMYLYMNGFSYMKMGYASAMAIVLFLIVLVVSFVAMYLMEKRVTYDVE